MCLVCILFFGFFCACLFVILMGRKESHLNEVNACIVVSRDNSKWTAPIEHIIGKGYTFTIAISSIASWYRHHVYISYFSSVYFDLEGGLFIAVTIHLFNCISLNFHAIVSVCVFWFLIVFVQNSFSSVKCHNKYIGIVTKNIQLIMAYLTRVYQS